MLSLPDWAFYPIATATAAGMIAAAMSFGDTDHRTSDEIRAEGSFISGEALAGLTTGGGLTAEFLEEDGVRFVRVTAARGPLDGMQSAGAFFTMSPEELEAFQGHRLRISFQIRASAAQGADSALLNLFTPDRGQGAWLPVDVTGSFATYELDVQSSACAWPQAFIAIWPDWPGNSNSIDLQSVSVTALEASPCDR